MTTNKLKINLYGEAWKLNQLLLTQEQKITFETIAKKMKQPLLEVIIDPYFYHLLKSKAILSAEDLAVNCVEGLLNTTKNQIEIWFKNKKVQKLKINDLRQELLFFPLYNTTIQKTKPCLEKGTYIEQKEIGLIGSFEVKTDNFNIDDLEFQLLQSNDHLLLKELVYNKQVLKSKRKDTLITFQNSFDII